MKLTEKKEFASTTLLKRKNLHSICYQLCQIQCIHLFLFEALNRIVNIS